MGAQAARLHKTMNNNLKNIKQKAGEPPALPSVHSRGYLPHIEGAEYQMITYRLADSLPKDVLDSMKDETNTQKRREQIESYLDAGYGGCWLEMSQVAQVVIENWLHFDGEKYKIIAYVVMPNHVHILIQVFKGVLLSSIVHSWKSYTSKAIMKLVVENAGEPPVLPIWQAEYWDRYIRNQKHFDAAIEYINQNPVKAGLVQKPEQWLWRDIFNGSAGGSPAKKA